MERQGQIVFSKSQVPEAIEEAFANEPTYKIDPIAPEPYSRTIKRAISFRIESTIGNFAQYVRTIKAFMAAKLPFKYIANAGTSLGDNVQSKEVTAPIQEGWQNEQVHAFGSKVADIEEGTGKVIAWQDRGEEILVTHQLPSEISGEEGKIIPIEDYLAKVEDSTPQRIGVVEGVGVYTNQSSQLPQASSSSLDPKDNPYLQAPVDLNKAV